MCVMGWTTSGSISSGQAVRMRMFFASIHTHTIRILYGFSAKGCRTYMYAYLDVCMYVLCSSSSLRSPAVSGGETAAAEV